MSTVCIHGLGYVGLPTAAVLATHDHNVVGYDPATERVERLSDGDVRLEEPGLRAFVGQALQSGNLIVSDDPVGAEYHVVCVPTPLEEDRQADLSYVREAGRTIAPLLEDGDTVILESTVPPGTTADVLRPVLEANGHTAGETFSLAHCPETVLPGNIVHEIKHNDRIVGGYGGDPDDAIDLYRSFTTGDVHATDATTAETVKLLQNTFRDVNVAFANEVAVRCRDLEIDSREAIELANTHPRVDVLDPGPGVGGHCLPVDPYFLLDGTDDGGVIEAARERNNGMVDHVVDLLTDALDGLDGTEIAVLGLAYKGGVDDTRNSPGLRLAERLASETAAEVRVADPYVDDGVFRVSPLDDAVAGAHTTVIATGHEEYASLSPDDLDGMAGAAIVDTRGVLDPDRWRSAGFSITRL